jgi:hypothetical protein
VFFVLERKTLLLNLRNEINSISEYRTQSIMCTKMKVFWNFQGCGSTKEA